MRLEVGCYIMLYGDNSESSCEENIEYNNLCDSDKKIINKTIWKYIKEFKEFLEVEKEGNNSLRGLLLSLIHI